MQRVSLKAEERGDTKGHNAQLRAQGTIPAVIYGKGMQGSKPVQVNEREFVLLSRKGLSTLLFDLDINGTKRTALVKECQMHVITRRVQHIDFYTVKLDEPIEVTLPVRLIGDAKGVKVGGRLEQRLYKIKVQALPEKIPNEIVVDVTEFDLGTLLHVRSLTAPEGMVFTTSPDAMILTIKAPKAAAEAETPAAGETTPAAAPATTPQQ